MKTNQTMMLTIGDNSLPIEHKTKMGSLTDLWRIGNDIRRGKGLTELDMSNYLRSQETLELVQAIEKAQGIKPVESTDLKNKSGLLAKSIQSTLIHTKRGKYGGGTWAHLYIMLDAASRLDADFKVMLFDILVNGKLLEWRDDGGDSFKALNIVLDVTISRRNNERPPQSVYIAVAKAIKQNVNPTGGEWNTATYPELQRRAEIEKQIMTILKLDLVDSLEKLLKIIAEI